MAEFIGDTRLLAPGGNRVVIDPSKDEELAFYVGRLADRLAAVMLDVVSNASGDRVAMLSRETSKAAVANVAAAIAREYARAMARRLPSGHPIVRAVESA